MSAISCASCAVKIEGGDVYYRPEDGAPVCHLCYLGVDRASLKQAADARAVTAHLAASGARVPSTCASCMTLIEGAVCHRPADNLAVCAACYLQNGGYHVVPKDSEGAGSRARISSFGYRIEPDYESDSGSDSGSDSDYDSGD